MKIKSAIGIRRTTVELTDDVTTVDFGHDYKYFAIRNDGSGSIYVSTANKECTAGKDEVVLVPSGSSYVHYNGYGGNTGIYISGTGTATVVAQDDGNNPFKGAQGGGDYAVAGASSYTLNNAVDYPLLGLNLYGKSTQDGTPTPENPVDIVSVGDSGSIEVQTCGKNIFPWNDYTTAPISRNNLSADKVVINSNVIKMNIPQGINKALGVYIHKSRIDKILFGQSGKVITLSCEVKSNYNVEIKFGLDYYKETFDSTTNGNRMSVTLTYNSSKNTSICWYVENASNDTEIQISNIQIEIGDTATDYEPYKGTVATITSALPLCGIPVDSGGNYTDSNGQQWACDELIYNADGTGKIIKRTAKIDSYNGETVSGMYISSTGGLDTGAAIIYQLDTPQKSELTAAEMAVLRELQTFDGVTNITNDSGADMDVKLCTNKMLAEYVFPITTGLQKQIDELKAAVISLGGNV